MNLLINLIFVFYLALNISAAPYDYKIGSSLQEELKTNNNHVNIIISLREKTSKVLNELNQQSFKTRSDRLNAVTATLKEHATTFQRDILQFLSVEPVEYKSLWISNQILVKGANSKLIANLASREDVSEIILDEEIPLGDLQTMARPEGEGHLTPHATNTAWGVESIEAPKAWDEGFTGDGAVIATVDTGVRFTHEALRDNFVGGEHGWYDPYVNSPQPNDQHGHGTHATGNIVGKNGIGVAPSAKWMACIGCATSSCSFSALIACGQWIVCPTKADGTEPDCSKAPHVVSNSWSVGRGNTFYNPVIQAYQAAGVIPVFSIGNTGPSCSTTGSPGDQGVIGVGALTISNELAYFSSVGPSMDGNIKPDVVAPGSDIYSSYHLSDSAYSTISGTQMACPHTAGVVALLVGADPSLTFEQVKVLLFVGADTNVVKTGQTCGGISDDVFPNNSFGYGKINAYNSILALLKSRST